MVTRATSNLIGTSTCFSCNHAVRYASSSCCTYLSLKGQTRRCSESFMRFCVCLFCAEQGRNEASAKMIRRYGEQKPRFMTYRLWPNFFLSFLIMPSWRTGRLTVDVWILVENTRAETVWFCFVNGRNSREERCLVHGDAVGDAATAVPVTKFKGTDVGRFCEWVLVHKDS